MADNQTRHVNSQDSTAKRHRHLEAQGAHSRYTGTSCWALDGASRGPTSPGRQDFLAAQLGYMEYSVSSRILRTMRESKV
jgi:hypothetical protein